MGDKKKRKAAFLAAHPICCYCGIAPASEPDHMPPRVMFKKREAPEGYEFPSCVPCNRGTKDLDQAAAFFVRALDQDDANYSSAEFQRQIDAIRNNYPHLMPRTNLSAAEKRSALRHRGDVVPPGKFLDDLGIVLLPAEFGEVMNAFAAKMTKALYYREVGSPLPADFLIYTRWFDFMHSAARETVADLAAIFPNARVGTRPNTDIGRQFAYMFDLSTDGQVFGFTAQLSSAIYIVGAAVHHTVDHFKAINDEDRRWTRAT